MLRDATLIAEAYALYPADVVLFIPSSADNASQPGRQHLIVGTYLLDEETRQRRGQLCIYAFDRATSPNGSALNVEVTASGSLQLLESVDCDAVLDIKLHQTTDALLAFVALSTGAVEVYTLHELSEAARLKLVYRWQVTESPEVLVLSLHSRVSTAEGEVHLLSTHSDGSCSLHRVDLSDVQSIRAELLHTSQDHSLECWIGAFCPSSRADTVRYYSGGDDAKFFRRTVQLAGVSDDESPAVVESISIRGHDAGVTAILPLSADIVLTGSYDDHIRLYDFSQSRRCITSLKLGGGVWRIIPTEPADLALPQPAGIREFLVCCMYGGAYIVRLQTLPNSAPVFEVVARFDKHESIVYGGDVRGDLYATCSFYDRRICIWSAS